MSKAKDLKDLGDRLNRNPRASAKQAESAPQSESETKRKPGRPKTKEPCETINIAVPIRLLNKWEEVKKALGGNKTSYVVSLIEKDMMENYDNYKQIIEIQEKMGL